jgi:seryl-tRNA synthetase
MLDINYIRENPDELKDNLLKRNWKKEEIDIVDRILELDIKYKELLKGIEDLRAKRNKISGQIKGTHDKELIDEASKIKEMLAQSEAQIEPIAKEFFDLQMRLPNRLNPLATVGKDESGNKVIRKCGEPTKFDFIPRDHMALGESLDLIDTETSARVSGARFAYLRNELVLMQFGLVNFVLESLTNKEVIKKLATSVDNPFDNVFVPVVPPVMIHPEVMKKMGRYEPFEERYYIPSDDLMLVGSAEHTLGPIHMDQVIEEASLPIRYIGYSTAFRREAGSYGKDMKGILRVHQFDKLEMESFVASEYSVVEQDLFVAIQEYFLQQLELPYQVVDICTGDMGGPDYRQIDIETWIPSQEKYRETHTADLMTDFQSRRLNIRTRKSDGSTGFVHMNDATAIAIGRLLIAILENYQRADGSVGVPRILRKYLNIDVIEPK